MPDQSPEFDDHNLLQVFLPRGLGLVSHVAALTNLNEQRARRLLEKHSHGYQPWFEKLSVSDIAGPGRPWTVYLLTKAGASEAANLKWHRVKPPSVRDPVEIRHAIWEMSVYTEAVRQGYAAEIEKVVKFGEGASVRFDVLIQTGERGTIFEIEQTATISNIQRIYEKLAHLNAFFSTSASRPYSNEIRVLFNLNPRDDLSVQIWRQALRKLVGDLDGEPAFSLRACPTADFQRSPGWEDLDGFQILEPAEKEIQETAAGQDKTRHPLSSSRQYIQALEQPQPFYSDEVEFVDIVGQIFADRLADIEEQGCISAHNFLDLVDMIYYSSFGSNPDNRRSASLPLESLFRLRLYFDRPRQNVFRQQLIAALKQVNSARYQGLRMCQDAMTRLIWDIFLRYHGIGRGGPVHIAVLEPGAGEWRTDFHVAVAFGIRRTNGDLSPDSWPGVREGESARYTERALAWTLEALWTYPQDLGLVEEKPRKGDKTK